jgi:FPC/CPF motif-containing protein YcgG
MSRPTVTAGHDSDPASLPDLASSLAVDASNSPEGTVDDVTALEQMILHPAYPCLGARSVFARERAQVEALDELGTPESAHHLLRLLTTFSSELAVDAGFASLLAVFHGPQISTEAEFERLLWHQLGLLHEADQQPWDPTVSHDPDDPHFAFSVAGRAYFVVGLHPQASRIARRMPHPTLVFNVHEQFEQLRQSERYERMRDTIRRRDEQLQGNLNPMVADHGAESEARQYSGRAVPPEWAPPGMIDFEDERRIHAERQELE